ncbi:ABC transporter permease [Thermomicrobiaceae bacterium CFH 74404]|uniref:Transport permease protein n=1 Tax=Thermalbibacter longus TaxID=2951981 RepID=A0AA41WEU7_9BACT|nr:ABC transporter permease [Thermalbibacter longus]MCM8749289.1 ABC transporter permease [Thermalbibacter longus]
MSWQRVLALMLRIVRQFRRDRRTLALILVVPVLVLSLLGYIYRGSGEPTRLAVVLQGESPLAPQVIALLEEDSSLHVLVMEREQALQAVDRREVDGVLVLPALPPQPGTRPEVELILEGSQPSAAGAIASAVSRALPQAIIQTMSSSGQAIQLEPRFLHGGPQFDQLDYFAPTFIGFFAFFFVFLLTSVSFLRERLQGSIERLIVSPLDRKEIVLGYMLGFTLFATVQSIVMVIFTVAVLRIHYAGELWLVVFLTFLLTVGAVNLGIFLSAFARTELQVVQFIPMVITPQGLLSGIIWPVDSLPRPLQWLAQALPLTWANEALRAVMIRGEGLDALGLHLMVLIGFAAAMAVLAMVTLRREVA